MLMLSPPPDLNTAWFQRPNTAYTLAKFGMSMSHARPGGGIVAAPGRVQCAVAAHHLATAAVGNHLGGDA